MYILLTTSTFEKLFSKLDAALQIRIKNELEQLKENPFVGKPLGYSFFREKKILNYRVYYVVYEENVVVFVLGLSNKKDQQKTIDVLKPLLPLYKEEVKKFIISQKT